MSTTSLIPGTAAATLTRAAARARTRAPKPLAREPELDFLRGLAILLVVDFHAPLSPLRPLFLALGFKDHLGWTGVDIFFVLSGFLVGGLLMREWQLHGRIDARRFLLRRGLKLWPQFYVFLLAVLVTGHRSLAALWPTLVNIQNYRGPAIAHTWSLAVEEHCYLLLTFALALAARWRTSPRRLFILTAAVCLAEIPLRYLLVARGQLIFLPTHARLDSIGSGVLLAMLFHFAPARFARLRSLTAVWLGCLALALLVLRLPAEGPWMLPPQHDAATLLAIALLMLVYRPKTTLDPCHPERSEGPAFRSQPEQSERLASPQRSKNAHSWPYRAVAWVGLYSYGIYLWHVAIIGPTLALAQRHPALLPPLATSILLRVAAIAIGVLTTELIELPTLRLRDRLFPRRVDSATLADTLHHTRSFFCWL